MDHINLSLFGTKLSHKKEERTFRRYLFNNSVSDILAIMEEHVEKENMFDYFAGRK